MAEPEHEADLSRNETGLGAARRVREELERRLSSSAGQSGAPQPPPVIPDHTLLYRVGSGSYGEVWLARNTLGTLRAVKVVYRAHFQEERPFEREFHGILKYEPVSRTHQGLVQVLHAGRNEAAGYFYYIMELADPVSPSAVGAAVDTQAGGIGATAYQPATLRSELALRERLPAPEAAKLVLNLAAAVGHLHARGLVHRDIKPSNVIFVNGQPKLADIGLVTDAGDSRSFVGTEGFIPPEGPGTPQADIFGLGKLLYELSTGRDRLEFPDLPADVQALPERESLLELNEILARACAPDQRERYRTATELQADLNLFLAGRSLRHARATERSLARLRQLGLAAGLVFVAVLAALWFSKRSERLAIARAHAEAELRARAEAAERATQRQLYTALAGEARATVRSADLGQRVRALDAIRRAAAISNTAELRCEALAALALPDLRFERSIPVDPNATLARLDPTFERIALCRGGGPIEIRSTADQRLLATLPASTNLPTYNARWSPDGRFLTVKRDRETTTRCDTEVWDVAAARLVVHVVEVGFGAVSFHPTLPLAIGSVRDPGVAVWELDGGKEIGRFWLPSYPVLLAISPDGGRFAAVYHGGSNWVVAVHNAGDGTLLVSAPMPEFVSSIDWDPDGGRLAVTHYGGAVLLMDARTGDLHTLGRHKAQSVRALFSPDGDYLLTGGWERELICWDMRAMRQAFPIGLESYEVFFRGDGRVCAVFSKSQYQIYNFERPIQREFEDDLGGRIRRAAFSPDGRWLAASGKERLGVWDLAVPGTGAFMREGSEARPFFSADSAAVFASRDGDGAGWGLATATNPGGGPVVSRLNITKPRDFTALCATPTGIAMTTSNGSQLLAPPDFASRDGAWMKTIDGISSASPDGRWLMIYRSFTSRLHVYRMPDLEEVAMVRSRGNVGTLEFAPGGDEIAIVARGQVEFWSTATWERTREITNFIGILYAPNRTNLWLNRDFRTSALYDARTLEPLLPLPTGVLPLALSQDGRFLATTVEAGRLQLWDLAEVRERLRELGIAWDEP